MEARNPHIVENTALSPAESRSVVLRKRNGVAQIVGSALICELVPLGQPKVARDFSRMTVVERTLEALRYNLALLEYRLGSNGWLRAWTISTLRVLLLFVIPVCALSILIAALVPAAAGLSAVFASLHVATEHMFWTVIFAIATCFAVAAAIALGGVMFRLFRRK